MRLKLTLQRTNGPEADIVVTTDAAATVGDVAAAIASVDPYRAKLGTSSDAPATLRVMGEAVAQLEPEVAVAEAAIGSGATVAVVSPQSAPPSSASSAAAALVVVEGPDAGRTFELPVGTRYLALRGSW